MTGKLDGAVRAVVDVLHCLVAGLATWHTVNASGTAGVENGDALVWMILLKVGVVSMLVA